MTQTLYWHDYETFGLDPARDRPAQFAGVRTDVDFNPIGKPLVVYCKPADDYLPQPEACLVTGITPQTTLQKGVSEAEFSALIHQQMAQDHTCTLGYNSLRFDDEVTRNILYRNFFDPYSREWQNGNSRWDLIDLVRAARALRPDGINWPNYEDGRACFRLEVLTQENGIEHASAHDALSDVYATIEFARLVKQAQPKLYQFLFQHRTKNKVLELLKLGTMTPLLHVSGMYASERSNLAVVIPLCKHPTNSNGVLVYDLSVDPQALLELSAEEIYARVFTAAADMPDGVCRIPLKTVHINKCPVLAPIKVLRDQDAQRLQIDVALCEKHLQQITDLASITKKLHAVFRMSSFLPETDPDLMLYSGGFFSHKDKALIEKIRHSKASDLGKLNPDFQDQRLAEMLWRYRARNFKQTLNTSELQHWREYCLKKLTYTDNTQSLYAAYSASLAALKKTSTEHDILNSLEDYAADLLDQLQ